MNLGRFINIWGRDYISRDFGGGPETKPGLRIFTLEIEFCSQNIKFFYIAIESSLKIAFNSDENCGFQLRKWANLIFFEKNLSNVVRVAIFI